MRRRYLVSGRVQGVGFRQFTAAAAQKLAIVGWVRNLPDGRVECEAQGAENVLSEFEKHIGAGPALARIDALEQLTVADEPGASTFEIRR